MTLDTAARTTTPATNPILSESLATLDPARGRVDVLAQRFPLYPTHTEATL